MKRGRPFQTNALSFTEASGKFLVLTGPNMWVNLERALYALKQYGLGAGRALICVWSP